MNGKSDDCRHILALSGGKDSAALAVYLKDKVPNLEYVFLDTGQELPETYDFLHRMRAILGIKVTVIKPKRDFDFWLRIFNGCLPSPNNRWCTRELKIRPYEKYLGSSKCFSYVAIRADEDRKGYGGLKQNIITEYPFIKDGITRADVIRILEESGIGMPDYYKWRSRSGCYFCFFQKPCEYVALSRYHPTLFEKACAYESNHLDGRAYTWIERSSLRELISERWVGACAVNVSFAPKRITRDRRLCARLAEYDADTALMSQALKKY